MTIDDPLIGKKLGDYTIQGLLGRGGMSRVYRGYDENLDRYAAVKVISGDFATTTEEEYTRRFQSEARAIAHLRHQNIVGIYQFGRWEGIYYMAQVFLEGTDLRMLLKEYAERGHRIPIPKMMQIVRDVANALDYAHEQGVIHRDIKPSNIMLEKKTGRAILMDFGLALSVHEGTTGDTFGSAHYIAPEQAISSAKAVPQSDLYSLGIVIYEMLAGKVPFDDPSVMSVALKHLNELPPPPTMYNPDLPTAVESVIMRVLDKDPKRRYETGEQLVQALEEAFGISQRVTDSQAAAIASVDKVVRESPSIVVDDAHRPASQPGPRLPSAPAQPEAARLGGLAGRFARRRAQKEEESATRSLDEKALQIDDDTLSSILKSYEDPRELGLVGPDAKGITVAEPAAPERDTPSAVTKEGTRRRSRLGVLLPLILVLGAVAVGLWLGTSRGRDDDENTTPSALTSADRTATAVAAAALPTEAATEEPTEVATEPSTQTPTQVTATEQPIETTTEEPTEAATEEPTQTATHTPTTGPTDSPEPAVTAAETAPTVSTGNEPNIRLLYDSGEFLIINISDQPLDISQLVFEQQSDGQQLVNDAGVWDRPTITEKPTSMAAGGCYQLVTNTSTQFMPPPNVCDQFLGFYRSYDTSTYFWVADEPDRQFTVRYSDSETPLATCEIDAGECMLSVDTTAGTAVTVEPSPTLEPSPTRTPTPTPAPNVRLIYNDDEFLLINISSGRINVSGLVFEQMAPDGTLRQFQAREWDSQGVVQPTFQMGRGGCYQVVTGTATRRVPDESICPRFLGWFITSVESRFFWIAEEAGETFTVRDEDSAAPMATCEIDLGECTFFVPQR
jgi:serine/threonine protein kinase/cytoskeletal protein RodZ